MACFVLLGQPLWAVTSWGLVKERRVPGAEVRWFCTREGEVRRLHTKEHRLNPNAAGMGLISYVSMYVGDNQVHEAHSIFLWTLLSASALMLNKENVLFSVLALYKRELLIPSASTLLGCY